MTLIASAAALARAAKSQARAGRNASNPLDAVWKALADETRREILDLLRTGPRTTTDIVERFTGLSRFGVMKHLQVLRDVGLVRTRAEGRRSINSLNAVPIRQIYERWVSRYADHWATTLVSVKESVENKHRATADQRGTRRKR